MKNTIGIFILIAVVTGCSFLNKKEEPKTPPAPAVNTATKTETTTPSTEKPAAGLTKEKFDQLKNGMKYEEVVKILGSEGKETSSSSSGSYKSATYQWEGENYARITITFRNDELNSKMQSGLKGGTTAPAADLTMAKYDQIKTGMSYEEVVKIIGSEGTQSSSSKIGSSEMASYRWEGDKYAKIFATFRDNKLSSKSQSSVK